MSSIAVIPARSGSKRLPDKNIRPLCGKPLLAYSVEAALRSSLFDVVHVSTDSEEYAQIAKSFGADVPFLRSAHNSSDSASSWSAVKEVLDAYSELGRRFSSVMLLQPTSPLRTAGDIAAAFALMAEKKADTVISVCRGCFHDTLPADGRMTDFIRSEKAHEKTPYYRMNGAIYLTSADKLKDEKNIYKGRCFAYIMEKERSVDIDDETDFLYAESMLRYKERWVTALLPTAYD